MPFGLRIEVDGADYLIEEPSASTLVGHYTLPFLASGGELGFVDLLVPSSGRFTQPDLDLLRLSGDELAQWRTVRSAVIDDAAAYADAVVTGYSDVLREWRALALCAGRARHLLTAWPTTLGQRSTWMPVGLPGGTEDLVLTTAEAAWRGFVATDPTGQAAVTHSARWIGARRPVLVRTVGLLARAVMESALRALPVSQRDVLAPLLRPIAQVARTAGAMHRVDPDISSWPQPFVSFAEACMRALVELQTHGRGAGAVPLIDTDELYEVWLASTIRDLVDAELGPHQVPTDGALASWTSNGVLIDLWFKASLSRTGRMIGKESFKALVAEELAPDVLLAASRDGRTRLYVLDAKSWSIMKPEDALSQSAKYLYGIRRNGRPAEVPAIESVDLVTSAVAPDVGDQRLSRICVTAARPTDFDDTLGRRVRELVAVAVAWPQGDPPSAP